MSDINTDHEMFERLRKKSITGADQTSAWALAKITLLQRELDKIKKLAEDSTEYVLAQINVDLRERLALAEKAIDAADVHIGITRRGTTAAEVGCQCSYCQLARLVVEFRGRRSGCGD